MNKVRMAFFSFTEVTDSKRHRDYNIWHQLDHRPENLALPGVSYGERWVSPPEYFGARLVSDSSIHPFHYMNMYHFLDPVEQTMRDFRDLGPDDPRHRAQARDPVFEPHHGRDVPVLQGVRRPTGAHLPRGDPVPSNSRRLCHRRRYHRSDRRLRARDRDHQASPLAPSQRRRRGCSSGTTRCISPICSP